MADADPLVAFLRACIAADETVARATSPSGRRLAWTTDVTTDDDGHVTGHSVVSLGDVAGVAEAWGLEYGTAPQVATHIARFDPARVLADCAAKTGILDVHSPSRYDDVASLPGGAVGYALMCDEDVSQDREYGAEGEWPCRTVLLIAQPYRLLPDGTRHPDWRDEWTVI